MNKSLKGSGFCSGAEEPDSVPEKPATLEPVIIGLGWFAGDSAEDREKKMDSYLASNYGLCGCGKPARYLVPNSKEGSCNKYVRCPSWEELNVKLIETTTIIGELLQWLRKREGEVETLKERTPFAPTKASLGGQAKAYKDVHQFIEQRLKG